MGVISVAFVLLAQFLTLAAQQRRTSEQRRIALQEAANVLERISALPAEELTTDRLANWQPSAELARELPQAKLQISLAPEAGPPRGQKVRVEVAWPNAAGELNAPIGLTAYRYAREAQP
jgi:hypothetical protein